MKKRPLFLTAAVLFVLLFCAVPGPLQARADTETEAESVPGTESEAELETGTKEEASVPLVSITTKGSRSTRGRGLTREAGYVDAEITLRMNGVEAEGAEGIEEASGKIKVRGNSTSQAPKKPYTFKLDKAADLMGFGPAKKWGLLANCFDPALMRNDLALDLAEALGLPCTPQHAPVEVELDGIYMGLYTLTEGIDAGPERIDLNADDGDFLLEYEKDREEGVAYIETSNGLRFAVSEPETPSEEQTERIAGILEDLIMALQAREWTRVQQLIDLPSFAAYYILNEYLGNIDFFVSSTYFFYKGGKLYAGPVWDHDMSMSNADPGYAPYYALCDTPEGIRSVLGFYADLMERPQFRAQVHSLFVSRRAVFEDLYKDGGWIDRYVSSCGDAIRRNEEEAGWRPGAVYTELQKEPLETFEENAAYLKEWLRLRHQDLTGRGL